MLRRLVMALLLSPFLVTSLEGATLISSVDVYWTSGGVSRSQTGIQPGARVTIQRDSGSKVNVRITKKTTAPATVNYTLTDWNNSRYTESTPTTASYWFFTDKVGPLSTEVWAGINTNEGTVIITVNNLATSVPDLVVSNTRVDGSTSPRDFRVGETVNLQSIVYNQGGASAASSRVGYYLGTSSTDTSRRWGDDFVQSLSPNTGSNEDASYTFQASDVGTRYFVLLADYQSAVAEGSNEGNNRASFGPFRVLECLKPSTPNIPTPADGAILATQPAALDWADTSGAQSYDVWIDGNSAGSTTQSRLDVLASLTFGEHTWQVRAKNDCGSTDGPLWRFTIQDRGTLQARVLDQNGNPKPGALCRLYDENGQSLGTTYERTAGTGGIAPAWTNLPAGRYIVKAFFEGSSPFPGAELWSVATVEVASRATTEIDLRRNLPYVSNHEVRLGDSNGALLSSNSEIEITNPFWVGVRIRQETTTQQGSRITVLLDRDRLAPWDFESGITLPIAPGSPFVFPSTFATADDDDDAGSYSLALKVETFEGGAWVKTDGWDWIDTLTIRAFDRTIEFEGITWQLSVGDGVPRDAISRWSRNPRNVWTDQNGLHLRIEKRNGAWYGPELVLPEEFGHGEYVFQIEGNFAEVDRHAVLGLFLIEPQNRDPRHEIDVEISQFGEIGRENGNYVLHPPDGCPSSNCHTFPLQNGPSTHSFVWSEDWVEFHRASGLTDHPGDAPDIASTILTEDGYGLPLPGENLIVMNSWRHREVTDTNEPSENDSVEFTIKKFFFRELAASVPPAAPTWLRTTATSSTTIDLLWDDNANNEAGFKVERKIGPAGPWTLIATLPANAETYQNAGLTCGTPHAYRVWAFNAVGESGKTNEAAATPECSCDETLSPENLSFGAVGGTGSFGVTACGPWTAQSDVSWIVVTSGASGSGNGTVGFQVDRNNVQSPRTGTVFLPELGLTFMVSQAAAPADPGFSSFLRLVNGTVAGQAVGPDQRVVTVAPGASLAGTLALRIDSSFQSNAVMALGITPSWGDHATSYRDLGHFSTPASGLARNVDLSFTAPSTPGTYSVIVSYRGEFNAGQVMSATNWSVGTLVWNNGDDLASWPSGKIEVANRDGNVLADYLYGSNIPTWVPATAITVVVQAPALQPPAAPSWLRTTPASSTSIDLRWDDNANNEDGFKVERKIGPAGPWTLIATLPANATTYQSSGLTCGTAHAYRVWAFNGAGDSGKTNEAAATPACP